MPIASKPQQMMTTALTDNCHFDAACCEATPVQQRQKPVAILLQSRCTRHHPAHQLRSTEACPCRSQGAERGVGQMGRGVLRTGRRDCIVTFLSQPLARRACLLPPPDWHCGWRGAVSSKIHFSDEKRQELSLPVSPTLREEGNSQDTTRCLASAKRRKRCR